MPAKDVQTVREALRSIWLEYGADPKFTEDINGQSDSRIYKNTEEALAALSRLEAQIEQMRVCLEWYADKAHYKIDIWKFNPIEEDQGGFARAMLAALAASEPKEEGK